MKLEIKITKEVLEKTKNCTFKDFKIKSNVITKAIKQSSVGFNCAISYATREIFPEAFINNEEIYFNPYINLDEEEPEMSTIEANITCDLPMEAIDFIRTFDNLSPEERVLMEPFSFEIDIPEEVINQIGIQEAIDIINKSETLQLIEA